MMASSSRAPAAVPVTLPRLTRAMAGTLAAAYARRPRPLGSFVVVPSADLSKVAPLPPHLARLPAVCSLVLTPREGLFLPADPSRLRGVLLSPRPDGGRCPDTRRARPDTAI